MLDFVEDTFHALTMDAFREQSRRVVVSKAKGISIDEFTRILESEIIKLGEAWKRHHAEGLSTKDAEIARLRTILAPLLAHAASHDYAPPIRFSVAACREMLRAINEHH